MSNSSNGLSEFFDDDVIDLTNINSSRDLPHKEKELDDRNKIYSTILENYSKYLNDTLVNNKSNKKIFLISLLIILGVVIVGFLFV